MKVLMICHRAPEPHGAGDAKIGWQALRALRNRGHEVWLVAPPAGRRPHRPWAALWGSLRGLPLQIGLTDDPHAAREAATIAKEQGCDVVIAVHARSVRQIPPQLRHRSVAVLIDAYGRSYASYVPHVGPHLKVLYKLEGLRMRQFERWSAGYCAQVAVVSRTDASFLIANGASPNSVAHLPYAVDLDHFGRTAKGAGTGPPTVALIGRMSYLPNHNAAIELIRDIAPPLRFRLPTVRIVVAGADPSPRLRRLAAARNVELLADVPDVRSVLAEATAVVIPIRIGGGVQTKILEAMAAKVPVVCTPFANAGVGASPGRDLLEAMTAAEFVAQVARLVEEPRLGATLTSYALRFVEDHNSPKLFEDCLLSLCRRVAA